MSKRIQYKVDGQVQGVCFRAYTVEEANKIGVTGFVKNASDGTVTGEAQGDDNQIQQFTQWLNKGPSAARVTGVEQSEIDPKQGESGFKQ
ncbi:Acylphosphatase-like protein [Lasiodiplodia theobromae]|uniref:Acylphosphatase n=2 Tax=Lasiodiplodia TaxID=66739 RepID=A0A5N5D8J4_9PEZI|nr:Acylphosphatase family protein [Lasiodiplodia theobromae]KAB2574078.1 Acylphosphatase-2 [Lasiodiplodia theobromae]KAF4536668.1 Acylphosphatase family protein [Lasiodiplodia theobromae]KAF9634477.1 Acylphosphatase-like protein [Lasiodiplodia theobromae]KAK0660341.1 Acylphosphatase-2 [Lasiodiplodia hormozganensis]